MEGKTKREIIKDEYPLNLLRAAAEEHNDKYGIPLDNITEDIIDGLEHILSSLPEREREILRLRYEERKTLREIGDVYGITVNAIRNQEYLALRKLRTPPRLGYIKYGKKAYEQLCAEHRAKKQQEYNERGFKIPLRELDLSVRAFNSLIRLHCETVADVIALTTEKIEAARKLGPKTLTEIAVKLEQVGAFDTPWTKYLPKEKN